MLPFDLRPCVLSLVPFIYVAGGNPRIYPPLAENAAQVEKGHFRMDTRLAFIRKYKVATAAVSGSEMSIFFARSRKSRACAEAYSKYAAQGIPQIDAEIAEKDHFWTETRLG
jgi:hypothetical protein